jgi:hypothetical protein
MKTKIYSVFPACGKTWLCKNQEDYGLKILDSDSNKFIGMGWMYRDNHWRSATTRSMMQQYIDYIKENIGKYDYIFVNSRALVRDALDNEGIDFTIVYPGQRNKAEWIGRCFMRAKNGEYGCVAESTYHNWDKWILECVETGLNHDEIVLGPCEHLSDYIAKKNM